MPRGYVRTSFGQIHYNVDGAGDPLLLVHFTAGSWRQWMDVIPCLAPHFRVYAFDTLGFGNSAMPPPSPATTTYARAIVEALDGLGVQKTAILGYRTGAPIVTEVAATYPERITRLILAGPPDYSPEVRAAKTLPSHYEGPSEDGSHLTKTWAFMKVAATGTTPAQLNRLALDDFRAGSDPLWAHDAILEQDFHERLSNVQAPTLLLYGETDRFISWRPQIESHLRDSRTYIAAGASPLLMLERPAEFCQAVRDFLSE